MSYHIGYLGGRVKRFARLLPAAARMEQEVEQVGCALCGRPFEQHMERHHVVPKSEGR